MGGTGHLTDGRVGDMCADKQGSEGSEERFSLTQARRRAGDYGPQKSQQRSVRMSRSCESST
jgi:hypothetical protein